MRQDPLPGLTQHHVRLVSPEPCMMGTMWTLLDVAFVLMKESQPSLNLILVKYI